VFWQEILILFSCVLARDFDFIFLCFDNTLQLNFLFKKLHFGMIHIWPKNAFFLIFLEVDAVLNDG
jgi:hypothetical protein